MSRRQAFAEIVEGKIRQALFSRSIRCERPGTKTEKPRKGLGHEVGAAPEDSWSSGTNNNVN